MCCVYFAGVNKISCVKCFEDLPARQFYKKNGQYPIEMGTCKLCVRKYQAMRRLTNPQYSHSINLKKYGLTVEEYRTMHNAQMGKCRMCGKHSITRLSVDHDHKTGRVRALLCNSCNALLGMAQEDLKILNAAIQYLEAHRPLQAVRQAD